MKVLSFVFFILCWGTLVTEAQDETPPHPESQLSKWFFFGPTQPYKVMIQSERGVVLGLDIPEGVFLGLEYSVPQEKSGDEYVFSGDIVIRTRRADEWDETTESHVGQDIVEKGPVKMVLKNVVVVVKSLGKKDDAPQQK